MSGNAHAADAIRPIVPDWDAGARVGALLTRRDGGVSLGAYAAISGAGGLNLGERCGDDPAAVRANRARLRSLLPAEPVWMRQVHGIDVHRARAAPRPGDPEVIADAAVTDVPGVVLAVLTADCLPVLLADRGAQVVGIAHAGWRGLAAGVLEATVARMVHCGARAERLVAYLGPAIGPDAFEVGEDVVSAFADAHDARAAALRCFRPSSVPGKWYADLGALARMRLASAAVGAVRGGGRCTVSEPEHFYSYRRDRETGRLGAFVWIDSAGPETEDKRSRYDHAR